MKHFLTGGVALAALVGIAAVPTGAKAMPGSGLSAPHEGSAFLTVANRRAPYRNVNRSNDAGNDTGDATTDQLNAQSLQRAQSGQPSMGTDTGMAGQGMGMNQGMGGQGMSGQGMSGQDMSSDEPAPRRRTRPARRSSTHQ